MPGPPGANSTPSDTSSHDSNDHRVRAGLEANVTRLYAFRFLRDFILIMPAIVPLYRATGLNATQILLIQAVFSAASICFEIPSGYLADVVGRRRALMLGCIFMSLGLAVYGIANAFGLFIIAEIVLAFGYSLFSGTESAMMFDSLQACGQSDKYARLEGRAEAFTRLGTGTAAIIGGFLAVEWLRLPFAANALTALLMLVVAIRLVEPPRPRLQGRTPVRDILRITWQSIRNPNLLPTMVLSAAILSTGIMGIWGYFLRLTGTGVKIVSYGFFFAAFQWSSAIAAATSDRLAKSFGPRGSYAILAIIPGVFACLAVTTTAWPVVLSLLAAAAWGFSTPLLLTVLNRNIEDDRRATVLSVGSMMGRVLFVIISPLFGFVVDRYSDRLAFGGLAVFFVLLCSVAGSMWLGTRARARE